MRMEPFKQEFRKIRTSIHHALHDRMAGIREDARDPLHACEKSRALGLRRTIRDVMQTCPIALQPGSPLSSVLALLIEHRISGAPVVDSEGVIVGGLNETDLLKIFYEPDATDVASVMTRDPAVIAVNAPLVDVVDQMMSSDFRRILVHQDGKLVGVVTRADLMPVLLEALADRLHVSHQPRIETGSSTMHH